MYHLSNAIVLQICIEQLSQEFRWLTVNIGDLLCIIFYLGVIGFILRLMMSKLLLWIWNHSLHCVGFTRCWFRLRSPCPFEEIVGSVVKVLTTFRTCSYEHKVISIKFGWRCDGGGCLMASLVSVFVFKGHLKSSVKQTIWLYNVSSPPSYFVNMEESWR